MSAEFHCREPCDETNGMVRSYFLFRPIESGPGSALKASKRSGSSLGRISSVDPVPYEFDSRVLTQQGNGVRPRAFSQIKDYRTGKQSHPDVGDVIGHQLDLRVFVEAKYPVRA